jgi:hypothetical protein
MFMSMVASFAPFEESICKIIGHALPLRQGLGCSNGEGQPPSRRHHDHARQKNIDSGHSDNLFHRKLPSLCLNKKPQSKGSWCCLDKRPAFLRLSPSLLLLIDFQKGQINRMPTIETSPHLNLQKLTFNIINAILDHEAFTSFAFHHKITFSNSFVLLTLWVAPFPHVS